MGKLQPNFSWQKYEGKPEDQVDQFQKRLQTEHVLVANSVNSTIDDLSYWERERPTAFTWVDSKQIYTKTVATSTWAAGVTNTIPLGIDGDFYVINFVCCISNGALASSSTLLLPHLDVGVPANEISIVRNGTNVTLVSGGTNRSAFSGYVTIYYTKG